MSFASDFTKRELVYRYGTQRMANEQCTADWVQLVLEKTKGGSETRAVVRAGNVCWNNAVRYAACDVDEIQKRLAAATGKRAVVDPSIDGWDGYVEVRLENRK